MDNDKKVNIIEEIRKLMKPDISSSKGFSKQLIKENYNRFLLLLSLVMILQIVFIIIEAVGILQWHIIVFISRLAVILICSIFISIMYYFGIKKDINKNIESLNKVMTLIQVIIVTSGCYFVVFMFNTGIYSFSAFVLVAFAVTLTCTKTPRFSSIMLFGFLIGLTVLVHFICIDFSIWYGEFVIALVSLFLISVGNLLNYNRHLNLFLKDRELFEANKKLEIISQTDSLTGIYNNRKITEVMSEYISHAKQNNSSFCLTVVDIDYFKEINDNYGHTIGDNILYHFAHNIKYMLRPDDVFARWGGDEFVIVFSEIDESTAFDLMENIRKSIEQHIFPSVGKLTLSAGIAKYEGENYVSKLFEKADFALYAAKESGRNQVQIYKPRE